MISISVGSWCSGLGGLLTCLSLLTHLHSSGEYFWDLVSLSCFICWMRTHFTALIKASHVYCIIFTLHLPLIIWVSQKNSSDVFVWLSIMNIQSCEKVSTPQWKLLAYLLYFFTWHSYLQCRLYYLQENLAFKGNALLLHGVGKSVLLCYLNSNSPITSICFLWDLDLQCCFKEKWTVLCVRLCVYFSPCSLGPVQLINIVFCLAVTVFHMGKEWVFVQWPLYWVLV